MRLIFLHGAPASGKFTIAKALGEKFGFEVFHNHLTIDIAKCFFEFGTADFWEFVQKLRLNCFREAAKSNKTIIYTSCYDHPNDLDFVEEIEKIVLSENGEFQPIYLKCEIAELEKRVTQPSRAEMRKINSIEGLRQKLSEWNCVAFPRENCLTIVTDGKNVNDCVEDIIRLLDLK